MAIRGTAVPRRLAVVFELGFRVFFVGAAAQALLAMALWGGVYFHGWPELSSRLSGSQWHAHEMIFGYALAVVAGFLLTAVRNWTGLATADGWRLAGLFALWAAARALYVVGDVALPAAAVCDGLFWLALAWAVTSPIVRVRQWRQAGVLAKLALLGLANGTFYAGAFGLAERGVWLGLHGGVFLLVSLILTIGARVLPGFIERGVSATVALRNPGWMTIASLLAFLVFFVAELFLEAPRVTAVCAAALCALTVVRLVLWHHPGIWRRPLLWGLYLAFASIAAGFALYAVAPWTGLPELPALHAFAVGGVGLATLSMMARVALGHSGRDIHRPPATVAPALLLLVLATVVRVAVPLLIPQYHAAAVAGAQLAWCLAFGLFLWSYFSILTTPRIDQSAG